MTDPVDYVECPLDVVLEYHTRATKLAHSISDSSTQLLWLTRLDEEERQIWSERYKLFKDRSLGSIIREVSKERSHLWVYHAPPGQGGRNNGRRDGGGQGRERSRGRSRGRRRGGRDRRDRSASKEPRSQKGKWADTLLDGRPLCPEYQHGKCPNAKEDCEKWHQCAVVIRANGRVCGQAHPATKHPRGGSAGSAGKGKRR